MTLDKDALIRAIGAHPGYDPETGKCPGGDDWCVDDWMKMLTPGFGGGAVNATASVVFLWPAWLGIRLWAAVWLAIPYALGFKARVVVVDGKASLRLVRRGAPKEPAMKAKAGKKA